MKPILSNSYYVNFNKESYITLANFIKSNSPSKIFILVDENTEKYCLPILTKELKKEVSFQLISIPAGENYKNLDTCKLVWETLTQHEADRKSLLINLGGGVITDLGGFVASAYKRGISFINIPTTLLSMVDASVGGKTGVDLGVLKNQIGLFSNPEMVIIDSEFLNTLSKKDLISGMAEVLKYGLTYDKLLWEKSINIAINSSALTDIVYRSIEIKNEIVLKDPKEANLRKVLNFGHTLGHAIESYFLQSTDKKDLTHGEAIAIGMITEAYLSHKTLGLSKNTLTLIKENILKVFDKVSICENDYKPIMDLLIHDKKNTNGNINFVLLKDLEKFQLDCNVTTSIITEALDYYAN